MEEQNGRIGRWDLPAERKLVTVMFADIAGFTHLAETLDPEQVRDLMNACFEKLVPPVFHHGGTVDKFIGDAIMALFGAPVTHENDPERALRAALSMQEAIAEFNKVHGLHLEPHFGINTGLVIAGSIGPLKHRDYSVMGDAVNLAAHLGHVSQGGEILVGPDTYRRTHHLFSFKTLGPLRLKGKADPVHVFRLLELRTKARSWPGGEGREINSPLVGRGEEVAVFTRCLDRLLVGQGGLLSIRGEAGLGKSRLVAEVKSQMAGQPLTWLEGRTFSYSQTISYWPFLEIIQADAGMNPEDDEERRWTKLESRISSLFPEDPADILPYLATLLALKVPESLAERIKYLDGETVGRQVFRSMRKFFTQLSRQRPLVLIFEDAQWMDRSSTLLLEHLMPLVREIPLLIGVVGRPESDSPETSLRHMAVQNFAECYQEINLDPLSPMESVQLIHNLLPVEGFIPGLAEGLLQKAEGNPFFLEEMVRALIDLGAFIRDRNTGRWQATAQVARITIPDTLQGVVTARIDRLADDLKKVLKMASVIGRTFFYRVLRGIMKVDQELDQRLAELKNFEFIREKKRIPELEYIFKHALLQEAAYESILLQQRKELHRQVGECVELLFANHLDEYYGLLAYHYTRAEEWGKAQDYLFKAGDQAGKIAADAEALEHYRQALTAHTRAFGNRWDPWQRAILERKMGEALFRRGQNQEAREYLLRALVSLGSPYPISSRGVRLTIGKELLRQAAHCLSSRFWGKLARHEVGLAQERCRIYSVMAWMDYFMDPERLILDSLLELNLAEQSGLSVERVLASMGVGLVCDAIPIPRIARSYHSRAVAVAEQTRQPMALGQAYLGLALHEHHALGEGEKAREHYRRSAAAYREAGHLRRWAGVKMAESLLWLPENLEHRLNLCQEVIRESEDAADHQAWGWGLFMLATTLDQTGALDEAVGKMKQALELLKSVPDYQVVAFASGTLGRCYLRQGNIRQAVTVLEEGCRLIQNHRLRGFSCVPVRLHLAQAYLLDAEQAQGLSRDKLMEEAREACRMALRQVKFDCAAKITAFRMQGTYEWLSGAPKRAMPWWQRSLAAAGALEARYELGLTCLEMGKFSREESYLKEAESIFKELGTRFDWRQAQELLARRKS